MLNKRILLLLAWFTLLPYLPVTAQTNPQSAGLDQMMQLLDSNGIKYDRAALESGAIESALQKVDSRARVLGRNVPDRADDETLESENSFVGGIKCFVINGFYTNDSRTVVQAIKESSTAKGFIIDLRTGGGNDYAAAAEAAGLLRQATGTVYSVLDLRGNVITNGATYTRTNSYSLDGLPVLIITDTYTSDASEFFTALLKNRPGVLVAGEKTSGDAYMRRWTDLDAGRIVYLPYARIVVPGCDYAGKGVIPDIVLQEEPGIWLEAKEPDRSLVRRYTSDSARQQKEEEVILSSDRILRKAVDLIHAIIALESGELSGSLYKDENNKNKGG